MSSKSSEQSPSKVETSHSGNGSSVGAAPRRASVLLAGVSGSARLREKLGKTEALQAVDRCMKRMERTVERFNGRIVKMLSDELTATFPHADGALQAAMEMQQRIASLPPVSGVKLEIRVGFVHGEVSAENGALSGEAVSLAALLASIAKPGQILTSREILATLSSNFLKFTRDTTAPTTDGKILNTAITEVFAYDPRESAVTNVVASANRDEQGGSKLRIQYRDQVVVFEQHQPTITLGRDQDCNLVVHNRRASRQHALIEWRNGSLVLIDQSTNGTFVALGSNPEAFIRRSELALRGKGTICFGGSTASPETNAIDDCAHFELFD